MITMNIGQALMNKSNSHPKESEQVFPPLRGVPSTFDVRPPHQPPPHIKEESASSY